MMPVRQFGGRAGSSPVRAGPCQILHAAQGGVLPEQTHDHSLAVQASESPKTRMSTSASVEPDSDAAILRQAFFPRC